jgi:Flp pilus assembly protein TadD
VKTTAPPKRRHRDRPTLATGARVDRLNAAAIAAFRAGDVAEACAAWETAAALAPGDYRIAVNLTAALPAAGRAADGARWGRRAVAMEPGSYAAWDNLGVALRECGDLAGAADAHARALGLQPTGTGIMGNLAIALAAAGRHTEALPIWERRSELMPGDREATVARGMARLVHGDFARGWADMELRLAPTKARNLRAPGVPLWDGSPTDGRVLLLSTDGFGDAVMGIRLAREARRRCGGTVVRCVPALARLLARADGVDEVQTPDDGPPDVAAQCSIHSLPHVLGLPEPRWDGPYLSADPAAVDRWRGRLAELPGRKVGVLWQGDPNHADDGRRSFALAELAPLAAVAGVSLVSLQRGAGVDQLAGCGFPVADLGIDYRAADLLETAAVIEALDLVVTPDTGLAHLAGALGRAAWLALCKAGEWRWLLDREDSPWYPSLRLFRQRSPGDWPAVFARMAAELRSA